MNKILCSTGALIGRPNNRDYTLLKPLSEKLDCDGFEFMMYDTWYNKKEKIVETLQKMHVPFPVMHCEKHIGQSVTMGDFKKAENLFQINCGIAEAIGASQMVLHLWDGEISDSNFQNNLNAFGRLREIADKYGIALLVENVVCNCGNPLERWCELHEKYPDIHFIYDTKMAAFHGQEEELYSPEYDWLVKQGHIRHFHVNDYGGKVMEWPKLRTLPVGAGHIDFDKFFSFVHKIHYKGDFTIEATAFRPDGTVDVDMLDRCFATVRDYLDKV